MCFKRRDNQEKQTQIATARLLQISYLLKIGFLVILLLLSISYFWEKPGNPFLVFSISFVGAAFLTFINLQNQTVAYQQSYGYNTPYQSVPYPTPAVPGNGSVQTPPAQPPYAQQPTYPAYPYYPPDYGYGYPYGYGSGEHGFGPWRGMG